ncbi:MAG: hypothetical protein LBS79_10770 [Tannerella sp.]|nr:hypothetical protein [Tannerella sp.]
MASPPLPLPLRLPLRLALLSTHPRRGLNDRPGNPNDCITSSAGYLLNVRF